MTGPLSVELGLEIRGRTVPLRPGIEASLVASAALDLSALKLRLERMRLPLALTLTLPATAAGAPTLEVSSPGLEGPEGGSAELALPGFSGGGYLQRRGSEWSGALEVKLGVVDVSGFGVLTTDSFSMLVVLAAEFPTPIQLSFGFTLVGVGGMVGINRRPDTEALVAATSSGDLAGLFFPRDPVADAPRILPTLAACFPQSEGDVVVGPMVKVGWGTPTLASATIGVLVGTEGVIVIGRIAVVLPTEDADLIHLEAVVFGSIDESGLFIAASLANSHIVGITITGDIRLRLKVGADGFFAFSAGGFHPAFTAPEGMGGMRRIGAELSPGDFLSIRLEAYVAVTSNSAQFGAGVDLYAGVAGFEIAGGAAFDALIVFDPFGFLVDFEAYVSAKVAGISVMSIRFAGHLAGPSPWCIRGSASISLPIIPDIDIDLPEISWGEPEPPPLPPARDPSRVLDEQLRVPANWTVGSTGVPVVVRLRPGVDRETAAVHPLGSVRFTQSAVPLNFRMQRVDGRPLPAATALVVRPPAGNAAPRPLPAQFAPSQFTDMDDRAKLSSSGYVTLDGGFEDQPTQLVRGPSVQTRDSSRPEITVFGDSLRVPRFRGVLSHDQALSARHGAVESAPVLMVAVKDPTEARVTSRIDPAVEGSALLAAGATTQAGVAEALLSAWGRAGTVSPDAVVARAWERSYT